MNATFTNAITALIASVKKADGFWGSLCKYAVDVTSDGKDAEAKAKLLKAALKNDEAAYEATNKGDKLSTIGAYRSAKSVLCQAVAAGLALVDENGNPVGKTAIEKALKEAKGASDKTPEEKCGIALATFESCLSAVDDVEALKRLASRVAGILSGMSDTIKASV